MTEREIAAAIERRTMRIYDYANSPAEVDLKKTPIREIRAWVVTGDEVVQILYQDGTAEAFDAGWLLMNGRMLDELDYWYDLKGDRIREWMEFVPEGDEIIPYQRAKQFNAKEGP